MVSELELVEYLLNVLRKAVEVVFEIGFELLLFCASHDVAQSELGYIVVGLFGCGLKCPFLFFYAGLVEHGFAVDDRFFGGFKERVQPANHSHRQDNVAVFAADVNVTQDIVGYVPDEISDPSELSRVHRWGEGHYPDFGASLMLYIRRFSD